MTKPEAWTVHISQALVLGSGLVYGYMAYFAKSEDPYAIFNHPWQGDVQHAHLLLAPMLVFAIGLVWSRHIWNRVRSGFRPRRRSGLTLALLFLPVALSGYLVQVIEEPDWRSWVGWSHSALSVVWALVYALHLLSPRSQAAESARLRSAS